MRVNEMESLIASVIDLATEQGARITQAVEQRADQILDTHLKTSIGDLVTDIDVSIQEHLATDLQALIPESSLLGEENLNEVGNGLVWIIDPVDGTTNMVHGLPHAAIAIALYESGEPIMGVVRNPFSGITFYGSAGDGAYERHGTDSRDDRQLHVSGIRTLEKSLVSFGLPYDRSKSELMFRTAAAVFAKTQDLRRSGSAALDLVSLSRGNLEAHIEALLRPWDAAASGLILEEAGGVVTDWDGHRIRWLDHKPGSAVLASNGHLHEALLKLVQSA